MIGLLAAVTGIGLTAAMDALAAPTAITRLNIINLITTISLLGTKYVAVRRFSKVLGSYQV